METDEPKPTAASLEVIWNTIKADYNNDIIDMNRRIEYPTVEELVVALWEKLVEVDGLTSSDMLLLRQGEHKLKKTILSRNV